MGQIWTQGTTSVTIFGTMKILSYDSFCVNNLSKTLSSNVIIFLKKNLLDTNDIGFFLHFTRLKEIDSEVPQTTEI